MSNPTTPFNWQMPTNTDLVTDLPADFEVFGQAVASSMADLLGGTTGQILSKATNADMDFTWIANDQGDITGVTATSPLTGGGTSGAITVGIQDASTTQKGSVQLSDSTSTTSSVLASTPTATKSAYDLANAAIAKTTVTTAGDIIYRNSTVPTRLGIGTAGQVLKVNSGATAPEWGTAATGGLTLITTQALSGVTSQSVNSCFSSTYQNYVIVFSAYCATSSNLPTLKLRASGTDSSSGYYGSFAAWSFASASFQSDYAVNDSSWRARPFGQLNTSSNDLTGTNMTLYSPFEAKNTAFSANYFNSGTSGAQGTTGGIHNSASSYDGFTITNATAMTGTVRVYGLAN
jgi:hypothetical protein